MTYHAAWLLPLLMIGCSCQRSTDETVPQPGAETSPALAPSIEQDAPPALDTAERARALRQAQAFSSAASTVHAYMAALPGADRSASDAFWSGGRPAPHPDDANLRGATGDLRSMRVQNGQPHALDAEDPARSVEVPVQLRIGTGEGMRRFSGWYRLRARAGGDGWELTSASLHPELR